MEPREKNIYRITLTGSVVNALLIVLKVAAGVAGRSSALIADAMHSLTDFITDIVVIIFVRISGKPRDDRHLYGHGKFETFATLIIGVFLAGAGIGLFLNGVGLIADSLHGTVLPEPTWIALVVALVSIAAKEILYRYTVRQGRMLRSDAVMANAWHHRSDAISSLGAVAGIAGAMFFGERWRILDPLAAVVVSLFIMKAGYDIVRPSINELLEGALPADQTEEISRIIRETQGVKGFHKLRTRKIGSVIAADVHVKMDGSLSLSEAHEIATCIERAVRDRYGADSMINIHMEPMSTAEDRDADE